jgi:hypothetical protein
VPMEGLELIMEYLKGIWSLFSSQKGVINE